VDRAALAEGLGVDHQEAADQEDPDLAALAVVEASFRAR
jgi:hypothetical protein